jgi:hypothetical protein
MDASNMLKPALARGDLRCIGATTLNEYQKYIEKDKALERRFQKTYVGEPSVEDAIAILRGLKERYEIHHGVKIKDSALIAAVIASHRYITIDSCPTKPSTSLTKLQLAFAWRSIPCLSKSTRSNGKSFNSKSSDRRSARRTIPRRANRLTTRKTVGDCAKTPRR